MATNIKGDLNVSGNINVGGVVDGVDISSHVADNSIHHWHTNRTNIDTINQDLGTSDTPTFAGMEVNGDVTVTGMVDGVDISAHAENTAIHHTHTNKAYLDEINQSVATTATPAFAGLTVNGDFAVTGKVDGVDVSNHAADTNIHHTHANKANLDKINQGLGTADSPSFKGLTVNGTGVYSHMTNTAIHHTHANQANLNAIDQDLGTANAPAFAGLTVNGDVAVTGKVDGVDVADHAADTNIHHSHANQANLDKINQGLGTADSPAFKGLTVNGAGVYSHMTNTAIHHTHVNQANLEAINQNLGTANAPAFTGLTLNGSMTVTGTVDGVKISAHAARHQSGGADVLTGNVDANARVQIKANGAAVGTRRAVNFIAGENVTLAIVDNPANETVNITISATGGSATPLSEMVAGVAGEALSAFDLCYLKADGKYYRANSLDVTTMPGLVLASAAFSAGQAGNFIRRGQVSNSNWAWATAGGLVYASGTPGKLTQQLPAVSGEQLQILGVAKSATQIDFEPNLLLVEVA